MKTVLLLISVVLPIVACSFIGSVYSYTAVPRSANVSPDTKKWTWTKAAFVPCENFGVNGTFSVNVEGKVESVSGARRITALNLWVFSASLANGRATVGATLVVKKDNIELQKLTLSRPRADESTIERTPQPNESKSLYLPKDKTVTIPTGAKIIFTVTVSVQTSSGSCSLGTSEKEIDPAGS